MTRFVRAMPLASAMAGIAAPAAAQTLRQAVEGAWAIDPQIATLAAKRDAIAARYVAARAWFPAPPAVSLSHATDQVIQNKRARSTVGEIGVPLWLPGEGTATEQVVDAELLRTDAQPAAARLRIAGDTREAFYAFVLAAGEAKIAEDRARTACELEADVARRERAGEVAALELDLARGERLTAETQAREQAANIAAARIRLQVLTGLPISSPRLDEPLAPSPGPETHPRLQAAARSIEAARASLRLAIIANRDSPEIGAFAARNRDIRGAEYDMVVGLRLRIPFATEARNFPRRAAAQAEVLSAQAEYAAARRQIEAELTGARQGLAAAQQQASLVAARLKALQRANARLRQSYNAGEIGLIDLLRARTSLYEAEAASLANRLAIARARSRVNQAAGVVP